MKKISLMTLFLIGLGMSQTLIGQSLIAYYTFANSPNDIGGNQYNGTNSGATITTDMFGNSNKAYSFNGVSNQIAITYSAFQLNQFTYSAWVNVNTNPSSGQYMAIVAVGGSTLDQALMLGNNSGASQVGFGIGSWSADTTSNSIYTGSLPTTGQWYHLVMTRGADSVIFYLDGARIGARNINPKTPGYASGLVGSIGSREAAGQYFNGKIDNVRIYDGALSPAQVLNLYNVEKANGLIGYYPFTGNANDISGNGHTGTVNGPVLTSDRFLPNANSNRAYLFDGSNDEIAITYAAFNLNQFTYSAWVYVNANPSSSQYMAILSIGGSVADQALMLGNNSGPSQIGFGVGSWSSDTTSNSIYTGSLPSLNHWYHLIATRGNDSVIFYVDGARIGARNVSGKTPGYKPSLTGSIGSRFGTSQYFNGKIDDVRIYNFAMSPSQVQALDATPVSDVITMGLNENKQADLVTIFPNPSKGSIHILKQDMREGTKLSIFNIQGTMIYENNALPQTAVEVNDLKAGIYFCNIEEQGKLRQTIKVLVLE